jgi:hypothetical protein
LDEFQTLADHLSKFVGTIRYRLCTLYTSGAIDDAVKVPIGRMPTALLLAGGHSGNAL